MDLKIAIEKFKEDIDNRIGQECEVIRKTDAPKQAIKQYERNIKWEAPELSAYIKKKMLGILNLDD